MQISPAGIAFITGFEGYRAIPYQDIAGHWTCGIGHKIEPGESFPDPVTLQQAHAMLLKDLEFVQLILSQNTPPSCTQNQWDALCDFGFNEGAGSLKIMLLHGWRAVPDQLPRWNLVTIGDVKVLSQPLAERRRAEVKLFLS